jgi:hypothetical protein
LTGDQAFCAQCFRCRNCKRKIENLRYARTSQGIFCMECHESLMARRRKRKAGGSSGKKPPGPNVKLDKSLPSLPPHLLEEAQEMDGENSEYTGTPDPNRMPETPDLNDERPGSAISNQQADSGKNPFLQPRYRRLHCLNVPFMASFTLDNMNIHTALYSTTIDATAYVVVVHLISEINSASWNSCLLSHHR